MSVSGLMCVVDAYMLFVMCVVDASWGSVSKEMKIVYVDVVCGCVIVCVQFFSNLLMISILM